MAGHLGFENSTSLNQIIVKIDVEKSLLYIKGQVPGPISGLVRIRDAIKKVDKQFMKLQYPTFIQPKDESKLKALPRVMVWEGEVSDPFEDYYHENDVVSGKEAEDE